MGTSDIFGFGFKRTFNAFIVLQLCYLREAFGHFPQLVIGVKVIKSDGQESFKKLLNGAVILQGISLGEMSVLC